MVTNTFRYRPGGVISTGNSRFTVIAATGDCSLWTLIPAHITDGTMVQAMCPHGEVGQGTIVFEARWTCSNWLAMAIGARYLSSSTPGTPFALTCSVDTRNAFEYHNVALRFQNATSPGSSFNKMLFSQGTCVPEHASSIIDTLFAISAPGPWEALSENVGNSAWFNSINQYTTP